MLSSETPIGLPSQFLKRGRVEPTKEPGPHASPPLTREAARLWKVAAKLCGNLDGRDVRSLAVLSRVKLIEDVATAEQVEAVVEFLELLAEMRTKGSVE